MDANGNSNNNNVPATAPAPAAGEKRKPEYVALSYPIINIFVYYITFL